MNDTIRLVVIKETNPYFNLAAEEYFLQQTDDNIIMLWQNDNTIVVGRYQNTLAEINLKYVEDHGVRVVRRQTGGGAVFHDMGNINFTFIQNGDKSDNEIDFSKFLKPILDALHSLEVPAEFSGRNDLVIEDKKISGNAMTFYKNRILEHGTLLFSSTQKDIAAALNVDPQKFADKAVKSVRKRITNISEYLKNPMTVDEFFAYLTDFISKNTNNCVVTQLTQEEHDKIQYLSDTKYQTWEWNFGNSPKYELNKKIKTKGGMLQAIIDVKGGKINDIQFFGDFFSREDPNMLAQKLIDIDHSKPEISKILNNEIVDLYFKNVTLEDLFEVMF